MTLPGLPSLPVPTVHGDGCLYPFPASTEEEPEATVLLSHGAGRGVDTPDLLALAAALPALGFTVLLFDQPWVVAGRRVASPPPTLDVGLAAAAMLAAEQGLLGWPLVVGGRSAGARSAARSATALGAAGCLALSFPLHPPGRPGRSRLDELTGSGCPTLVVQGEHDTFGTPAEFPDDTDLVVVPFADHGLHVPARAPFTDEDALAVVVEATTEWLVRVVAGNAPSGAAVHPSCPP